MRELTEKEKELLAGGIDTTDFETFHVYGFWTDFGNDFHMWNDPFEWDKYYDYYLNDGGGGGGGETYQCDSLDPVDVESYVDALASKLARDIVAKPDDHEREYMGIIYRDGHGVIRTTQLYTGATADRVDVRFDQLGFPASQIIALVHNHDKAHYGRFYEEAQINRFPSAADWQTADLLVGEAGVDSGTLKLYLLDTESKFRQYDYADKSRYLRNGQPYMDAPLGDTTSKTLEPSYCPA